MSKAPNKLSCLQSTTTYSNGIFYCQTNLLDLTINKNNFKYVKPEMPICNLQIQNLLYF